MRKVHRGTAVHCEVIENAGNYHRVGRVKQFQNSVVCNSGIGDNGGRNRTQELGQTVSEFEFSAKIGARMHPSEFRGQLQHLLVHRENREFRLRLGREKRGTYFGLVPFRNFEKRLLNLNSAQTFGQGWILANFARAPLGGFQKC